MGANLRNVFQSAKDSSQTVILLALFKGVGNQVSAPSSAKAERRLHSWGLLGIGLSLSQSVASSVALEPNLEACSPDSSDPVESMSLNIVPVS